MGLSCHWTSERFWQNFYYRSRSLSLYLGHLPPKEADQVQPREPRLPNVTPRTGNSSALAKTLPREPILLPRILSFVLRLAFLLLVALASEEVAFGSALDSSHVRLQDLV